LPRRTTTLLAWASQQMRVDLPKQCCDEDSTRLINQVSLPADAKRERVEAVLAALGLKPCRDVLIGDPLHRGISGAPSAAES